MFNVVPAVQLSEIQVEVVDVGFGLIQSVFDDLSF